MVSDIETNLSEPVGDKWMLDQTALFHCSTRKVVAKNDIRMLTVGERESIVAHPHSSPASVVEKWTEPLVVQASINRQ